LRNRKQNFDLTLRSVYDFDWTVVKPIYCTKALLNSGWAAP